MGSEDFMDSAPGSDPAAAFASAVSDARYEHGHGGYTGSIAEKSSYVVITSTPMLVAEARKLAEKLLATGDPRVDDKWGPAGAIPVIRKQRNVQLDGLEGGDRSEEEVLRVATEAARRQRLIRRGEKPVKARLNAYATATGEAWQPPSPKFHHGHATLTLERSKTLLASITEPDGWLFFGWASA